MFEKSVVVCSEVSDLIAQYPSMCDCSMCDNHYEWINAVLESALTARSINIATYDLWKYRNFKAWSARRVTLFHVEQIKDGE